MKKSDCGYYMFVMPDAFGTLVGRVNTDRWFVLAFTESGKWQFVRGCASKEEAYKARREMYRLHQKINKKKQERKTRRRVAKADGV